MVWHSPGGGVGISKGWVSTIFGLRLGRTFNLEGLQEFLGFEFRVGVGVKIGVEEGV